MSTPRVPPPPPLFPPRRISKPLPPKPASPKTTTQPFWPPTSPTLKTSSSDATKLQSSYKQSHNITHSRSQPNTPPPPRSKPIRLNITEPKLWHKQRHNPQKHSSSLGPNYNYIRPKSARTRREEVHVHHRRTKMLYNHHLSKSYTARPPPVPQHVLRGHTLDFVPELQAKKAIPPPPPKLPESSESIIESFAFATQEYDHSDNDNNNISRKRSCAQFRRKKRESMNRNHTRVRSMGIYPSYAAPVVNNDNSERFNALLCTQGIETYEVVFTTRVCGIELVAFDDDNNLGALVIKCHTNHAKKYVIKQSLLISINGDVCVDTEYQEILSLISASSRPLTLTFYSQEMNQIDRKKSTPIDDMLANDEEDDLRDMHKFPDPKKLFVNNEQNSVVVERSYTMLYHKYMDLAQFQELTRDIINDKTTEIKRLMKETDRLRTILNKKESALETLQINQSTEKQKGREILGQYHKMSEKNLELERKNMDQQQKIQQMQYDLKQQKIFIREYKRRQKQKKRNHTHYVNYGALAQHKGSQNGLHNEIKHRLHQIQKEKMSRKLPPAPVSYRSVPNIHKAAKHHRIKAINEEENKETDEDDNKSLEPIKKRGSAINIFFSHFGKSRKYSNDSEPDRNTLRLRESEIKRRSWKKNKKKSRSDLHKKKAKSRTTRVRSNSAESNLNSRMRKETIV